LSGKADDTWKVARVRRRLRRRVGPPMPAVPGPEEAGPRRRLSLFWTTATLLVLFAYAYVCVLLTWLIGMHH